MARGSANNVVESKARAKKGTQVKENPPKKASSTPTTSKVTAAKKVDKRAVTTKNEKAVDLKSDKRAEEGKNSKRNESSGIKAESKKVEKKGVFQKEKLEEPAVESTKGRRAGRKRKVTDAIEVLEENDVTENAISEKGDAKQPNKKRTRATVGPGKAEELAVKSTKKNSSEEKASIAESSSRKTRNAKKVDTNEPNEEDEDDEKLQNIHVEEVGPKKNPLSVKGTNKNTTSKSNPAGRKEKVTLADSQKTRSTKKIVEVSMDDASDENSLHTEGNEKEIEFETENLGDVEDSIKKTKSNAENKSAGRGRKNNLGARKTRNATKAKEHNVDKMEEPGIESCEPQKMEETNNTISETDSSKKEKKTETGNRKTRSTKRAGGTSIIVEAAKMNQENYVEKINEVAETDASVKDKRTEISEPKSRNTRRAGNTNKNVQVFEGEKDSQVVEAESERVQTIEAPKIAPESNNFPEAEGMDNINSEVEAPKRGKKFVSSGRKTRNAKSPEETNVKNPSLDHISKIVETGNEYVKEAVVPQITPVAEGNELQSVDEVEDVSSEAPKIIKKSESSGRKTRNTKRMEKLISVGENVKDLAEKTEIKTVKAVEVPATDSRKARYAKRAGNKTSVVNKDNSETEESENNMSDSNEIIEQRLLPIIKEESDSTPIGKRINEKAVPQDGRLTKDVETPEKAQDFKEESSSSYDASNKTEITRSGSLTKQDNNQLTVPEKSKSDREQEVVETSNKNTQNIPKNDRSKKHLRNKRLVNLRKDDVDMKDSEESENKLRIVNKDISETEESENNMSDSNEIIEQELLPIIKEESDSTTPVGKRVNVKAVPQDERLSKDVVTSEKAQDFKEESSSSYDASNETEITRSGSLTKQDNNQLTVPEMSKSDREQEVVDTSNKNTQNIPKNDRSKKGLKKKRLVNLRKNDVDMKDTEESEKELTNTNSMDKENKILEDNPNVATHYENACESNSLSYPSLQETREIPLVKEMNENSEKVGDSVEFETEKPGMNLEQKKVEDVEVEVKSPEETVDVMDITKVNFRKSSEHYKIEESEKKNSEESEKKNSEEVLDATEKESTRVDVDESSNKEDVMEISQRRNEVQKSLKDSEIENDVKSFEVNDEDIFKQSSAGNEINGAQEKAVTECFEKLVHVTDTTQRGFKETSEIDEIRETEKGNFGNTSEVIPAKMEKSCTEMIKMKETCVMTSKEHSEEVINVMHTEQETFEKNGIVDAAMSEPMEVTEEECLKVVLDNDVENSLNVSEKDDIKEVQREIECKKRDDMLDATGIDELPEEVELCKTENQQSDQLIANDKTELKCGNTDVSSNCGIFESDAMYCKDEFMAVDSNTVKAEQAETEFVNSVTDAEKNDNEHKTVAVSDSCFDSVEQCPESVFLATDISNKHINMKLSDNRCVDSVKNNEIGIISDKSKAIVSCNEQIENICNNSYETSLEHVTSKVKVEFESSEAVVEFKNSSNVLSSEDNEKCLTTEELGKVSSSIFEESKQISSKLNNEDILDPENMMNCDVNDKEANEIFETDLSTSLETEHSNEAVLKSETKDDSSPEGVRVEANNCSLQSENSESLSEFKELGRQTSDLSLETNSTFKSINYDSLSESVEVTGIPDCFDCEDELLKSNQKTKNGNGCLENKEESIYTAKDSKETHSEKIHENEPTNERNGLIKNSKQIFKMPYDGGDQSDKVVADSVGQLTAFSNATDQVMQTLNGNEQMQEARKSSEQLQDSFGDRVVAISDHDGKQLSDDSIEQFKEQLNETCNVKERVQKISDGVGQLCGTSDDNIEQLKVMFDDGKQFQKISADVEGNLDKISSDSSEYLTQASADVSEQSEEISLGSNQFQEPLANKTENSPKISDSSEQSPETLVVRTKHSVETPSDSREQLSKAVDDVEHLPETFSDDADREHMKETSDGDKEHTMETSDDDRVHTTEVSDDDREHMKETSDGDIECMKEISDDVREHVKVASDHDEECMNETSDCDRVCMDKISDDDREHVKEASDDERELMKATSGNDTELQKETSDDDRDHMKETFDDDIEQMKETSDGNTEHMKETSDGNTEHTKETSDGDREHTKETSDGDREHTKETSDGDRECMKEISDDDREHVNEASDDDREHTKEASDDDREHTEEASDDDREHMKETSDGDRECIKETSDGSAEHAKETLDGGREHMKKTSDDVSKQLLETNFVESQSGKGTDKHKETIYAPGSKEGVENEKNEVAKDIKIVNNSAMNEKNENPKKESTIVPKLEHVDANKEVLTCDYPGDQEASEKPSLGESRKIMEVMKKEKNCWKNVPFSDENDVCEMPLKNLIICEKDAVETGNEVAPSGTSKNRVEIESNKDTVVSVLKKVNEGDALTNYSNKNPLEKIESEVSDDSKILENSSKCILDKQDLSAEEKSTAKLVRNTKELYANSDSVNKQEQGEICRISQNIESLNNTEFAQQKILECETISVVKKEGNRKKTRTIKAIGDSKQICDDELMRLSGNFEVSRNSGSTSCRKSVKRKPEDLEIPSSKSGLDSATEISVEIKIKKKKTDQDDKTSEESACIEETETGKSLLESDTQCSNEIESQSRQCKPVDPSQPGPSRLESDAEVASRKRKAASTPSTSTSNEAKRLRTRNSSAPVRMYLEQFVPFLLEGLLKITYVRPEDPIQYLADWMKDNKAAAYRRMNS